MTAATKLNGFAEHLAEKTHNLGSDQFTVYLTNTAPASESTPPTGATGTNVVANLTQISYTNLSSRNFTTSSSSQTAGTYTQVLADLVLTASGAVGPYRYYYIGNSTAAGTPLVGYYDRGSSITLASGETDTVDFSGAFVSLA